MRTLALPAALLALSLTACGSSSTSSPSASASSPATSSPATSSTATSSTATPTGDAPTATSSGAAATAGAPVTAEGAWVKATTGPMTGVFGTLRNTTDQPVVVKAATTPSSSEVQLHATVKDASGAMVMKEATDGFTIPAHGTFVLQPGANHIMLMKLTKPVETGVAVPLTLVLGDGRTVDISAQGRAYSGAKETYAPQPSGTTAHTMDGHAGMPSGSGTASH